MKRKRVIRRPADTFKYIFRKILLVLMAAIVAFPVFYMLTSSLFTQEDFNRLNIWPSAPVWGNYGKALGFRYFGSYVFNSIGTAVLAALVRTVVIVCAAFAFTHLRFRGKTVILTALILTLFVPQEAILYQNYRMVAAMGLINTWLGIISTSLFSAAQMLLLMGSFHSLGNEPYDAARIDGASDIRYIWNILVPLSAPAVLTVMIQTLITVFNSYLWPLLVTNRPASRTIQVGITMLGFAESGERGAQMASLAIVTLPFLAVLAFTKKRIQTALIRR